MLFFPSLLRVRTTISFYSQFLSPKPPSSINPTSDTKANSTCVQFRNYLEPQFLSPKRSCTSSESQLHRNETQKLRAVRFNRFGLLRRGLSLSMLLLRCVRTRCQLPSGASRALDPLRHVRILAVDLRAGVGPAKAPVPRVQIQPRTALLFVAFWCELLRVYGGVEEEDKKRGAATWQRREDEAREKGVRGGGRGSLEEGTCEEAGGT